MRPLFTTLALLLSLISAFVACDTTKRPAPPAEYTVRGRVEKLTQQGDGAPMAVIHHEAIAGFRNRAGEAVGMESMQMAFGYDPQRWQDALKPGQVVEMTFQVRWEQSPPLMLTRVKPLPEGTQLTLAGGHAH